MKREHFFVLKETLKNGTTRFSVVRKNQRGEFNTVNGYNVYTEEACIKLAERIEGELLVKAEYL